MERYLLVKEHFTDGTEYCYRSFLFTVEPDGSKELWDIFKFDTEAELDERIRDSYGIAPPPVDSEIRFNSDKMGMP